MPTRPITQEQYWDALDAVERHPQWKDAAAELGISPGALRNRINAGERQGFPVKHLSQIELPEFPNDDVPIEEIIEQASKRFEVRKASHDAHTWFPVKIQENLPIGLLHMGDPHVDDNGCNWPVLRKHCDICQRTDGLYAVNIGDTTNNWSGRLANLYAKQDTSKKTARRMAEWLMLDSGVRWLIWLVGNHDAWGEGEVVLSEMAKRHKTQKVICHDWEARCRLMFPNGNEIKAFFSHDFKGHSQWNPNHGPMKAGMMGADAHLFVAGHKHNWIVTQFENADKGIFQTFIRVRGYKYMDDYARRLGIAEQEKGSAILTVINPLKEPNGGGIIPFEDVEAGAEFLTWLRKREA